MSSVLLVNCGSYDISYIENRFGAIRLLNFFHRPRVITKPINILYLTSSIIKSGHDCDILDLQTCKEEEKEKVLRKHAKNKEWIGFSFNTISYYEARRMARLCKNDNPDVNIIFGGPHATFTYKEILENNESDYVIRHEGESTISKLVSGEDIKKIPNLSFKEGEAIKNNPYKPIRNLDSIPFPARWKLKPINFNYQLSDFILSSRGCPVGCNFCVESKMFPGIRLRSVNNVVDELEVIKEETGEKNIRFLDSNFSVSEKHTVGICKEIINRKLELDLICSMNVDHTNKKMLDHLKKAGFKEVGFGVESLNEKILCSFGKTSDEKNYILKYKKILKYCKKIGLEVASCYIIPKNGDKKTILSELQFLKKFGIVKVRPITPFPGTEIWEDKENFLTQNLEEYNCNNQIINSDTLSEEDVKELLKKGFSFSYLMRTIASSYLNNIKPLRNVYKLIK